MVGKTTASSFVGQREKLVFGAIPFWLGVLFLFVALFSIAEGCQSAGRRNESHAVVVYVSEDQVFSEPILKDFERETGIKVQAVFDTEETKSTGVMNRLLAERENPQADVYWANEPFRAEVLKQERISAPYRPANADEIPAAFKDPEGYWTGFSARARVLVLNKAWQNVRPASILDYSEPRFKGKGVIANPLFGTTTAYLAALFTLWGDERGREFLEKIKSNGVKVSTSNGESADLVASGEFAFSLVDSDDAFSRLEQSRPIEIVYPDQGSVGIGCMIIPNAVALIQGGSNPANAKKLIEYLVSRDTERKLAFSDAAQIPLHPGVETPPRLKAIETLRTMKMRYSDVALKMREIQPILKNWVGY